MVPPAGGSGSLAAGDPDYRRVERVATLRSPEECIPVVEYPAVGRHFPVALTVRRGSHPNHRLVERDVPGRAEEWGVECEQAAVRSDVPVPPGSLVPGDPDYRLVERLAALRSIEDRVTEAEGAAVRCDLPVALTVRVEAMPTMLETLTPNEAASRRTWRHRRRRDHRRLRPPSSPGRQGRHHADHRRAERHAPRRSEERSVEGEQTTVGRDLPVATRVRVGRDADNRLVERLAAHRAEERGVVGEDSAVGRDLPIAELHAELASGERVLQGEVRSRSGL